MDTSEKSKMIQVVKEIRNDLDTNDPVSNDENRLNWMYKKPSELIDREEYLLGKAIDKSYELLNSGNADTALGRNSEQSNIPKRLLVTPLSTEQVDIAKKIHEDPLYAIKQKEMEARRKLLNNPVKLKQLKQMLLARQEQVEKKKSKKKKKRRGSEDDLDSALLKKLRQLSGEKKMKTLQNLEKLSSDSSSSEDDSEPRKSNSKSKRKGSKGKRKSSRHRDTSNTSSSDSESEKSVEEPKKNKSSTKKNRKKRAEVSESSDDNRDEDDYKHKKKADSKGKKSTKSDLKNFGQENQRQFRNIIHKHPSTMNKSTRHSRRSRSYDSLDRYRRRKTSNPRSRSSRYTNLNITETRKADDKNHPRQYHSKDSTSKSSSHHTERHSKRNAVPELDVKSKFRKEVGEKNLKTAQFSDSESGSTTDSNSSDSRPKKRNRKFGLMMPDGSKPISTKGNLSAQKQFRYEKKPEPEKPKYVRPEKKEFSDKEKEEKLKEMMENAKWRKEEREKNLHRHRKAQKREEKLEKYDEDFMRRQISIATSHGSMADRIRSNINNIQRSKISMDQNFMRK